MAIFYQHIGREMWARDAPRTLGADNGLKRFNMDEIGPVLTDVSAVTVETLTQLEREVAPTGFQIWGLPSGAERVLRNMCAGDYLLLLESESFRYIGQVLEKLPEPSWNLSQYLWGEPKFPQIVFLQGQIIKYDWDEFKRTFGFDARYHMRGNTMRLSSDRFQGSGWASEEAFVSSLFLREDVRLDDLKSEFQLFAERAEAHLRYVKDRSGQANFRDAVLRQQGAKCAACSFDIPEGLEAAHLVPFSSSGSFDSRNGIAFCVLHHRLFDRGLFSIDPDTLKFVSVEPWRLSDLRISNADIRSLRNQVHEDALRWNAHGR